MSLLPAPIRRVLTGHNAEGQTCVIADGPSPVQLTVDARPGYRVTNLWRTKEHVHVNDPDDITDHKGILPPTGGTILRIIDWPAEPVRTAKEQRALVDQTFSSLYPDAERNVEGDVDPTMHRTSTVDYALVLEGEIFALLDQEEVLLRAGDVLNQRGTNHGWANRSGKAARIAFILIDAQS